MRKLFIFGLIITFLWLLVMIFIFRQKTSFTNITVSELGDFLGGFFSPVAFLWLILGYIQQGHELQQNTTALKQQKDEYLRSVQLSAHIAMVEHEAREVDFLEGLSEKTGKDFWQGANNARNRGKIHKAKIEELLADIEKERDGYNK